MKIVAREEVERLPVDAQLVEVLPAEEYEWAHLPSAIHLPLRDLHDLAPQLLDPKRPVVTGMVANHVERVLVTDSGGRLPGVYESGEAS